MAAVRGEAILPVMAKAGDSHQELLGRLARAMDDGRVSVSDVEGLLARRGPPPSGRPTTPAVLYALGSVVVLCGLAIAYGTVAADLPRGVQMTAPFLFPLVALGACAALARRGAPPWQADLAGLIGYVALGVAFGVSGAASGRLDTGDDVAAAVAVAALVAIAVVLVVHRLTRSRRLLWVGMPAALAALGIAVAYLVGAWSSEIEGPDRLGWVILAEAGVAAAVAVVVARRDRAACLAPVLWAVLGGYAAVLFAGDDLGAFGPWHVILAAIVVAAFLTAAALDLDVLIWLAAAGGALWVVMIAVVVGSATGAALAVVLAGIGLVGLGLLVARLLRARAAG